MEEGDERPLSFPRAFSWASDLIPPLNIREAEKRTGVCEWGKSLHRATAIV